MPLINGLQAGCYAELSDRRRRMERAATRHANASPEGTASRSRATAAAAHHKFEADRLAALSRRAKNWDEKGVRLTDCCSAYSKFIGDDLVCRSCVLDVWTGEGDGTETREV